MASTRMRTTFCSSCHAPLAPGWGFCGACGRRLLPAPPDDASVTDAPPERAGAAGTEPGAGSGAGADIVVFPTSGVAPPEPAIEAAPLEAPAPVGEPTEVAGAENAGRRVRPERGAEAARRSTTAGAGQEFVPGTAIGAPYGDGAAAPSPIPSAGSAAVAPGAAAPTPPSIPPAPLPRAAVVLQAPVANGTFPPRPSRFARHRRSLVRTVIGAVAIIVVAVAVSSDLGVRSRLDRARLDLAGSRSELERTSDQLGTTWAELDTTKEALASSTSERDAVRSELDATLAELAGLRGSLGDAQDRLNLQAGQIETLKSCLNGVSEALGHAAYDDYRSAVAALDAVEVSCDRASEMF